MKYLLDAVLVIGLLWLAQVWNGERKNGIALEKQLEVTTAKVVELDKKLVSATNELNSVNAKLSLSDGQIVLIKQELQDMTDSLSKKDVEIAELRTTRAAAYARIKELEGYKAKAIVAEMPQPAK